MIKQIETPNKPEELLQILNPLVKKWFFSRFKEFSLPQLHGVMPIHSRENILVSAPTGATKTLTGFLAILNELVDLSEKNLLEDKVYCVYISPLKALNNDIYCNLMTPLKEMEALAGKELGIRVAVRTGDTTASEKAKMLRKAPHILITTPESLAIVINSLKFKEYLKGIEWCIIDEIHALAENKRGVHLSLTMERLQRISNFARVGLSATVAPLEEIAKFLVGNNRDCKIADIRFLKNMDLQVMSPTRDLINVTYDYVHNKLYDLIDRLIQEHKTTLIFTNTRSATERVVHHLKQKFPSKYTENIGAHHGSLSKAHRTKIEQDLREGKLKCVVCSTSLELGIDIGFVDLVILLGSPKSVARALQRVGRSGHQLHSTTKGRIIVLDRDDLVECSVLLKSSIDKKIDRVHIPTNCLDVLAQHVYGIAIEEPQQVDDVYNLIKKSYCYRDLTREDFWNIIDYLAGKYSSLEDRHVYAKIWYDEKTGKIGRRSRLGRVIYMTNIGTIPEETMVHVKIGDQHIGMIDEGFAEKLRQGDIFVLGGNTYRFKFSRGMVAQVTAVAGAKPTVPSWFSEMLPLSFDLANDIGKFRRLMEERFNARQSKDEIVKFINEYIYVDDNAANAIYEYFNEQYLFAGEIPTDKKIIIEHYNEEDKKYVVFHTLFGRRVNDCLSRAFAYAISRVYHKDSEIGISDNGFYLSYKKGISPQKIFSLLKSSELREVLDRAIDKTEVLNRRFRHCAMRSLMILRTYKGQTKRVGRQQVGSMILMSAVKRISNDFPILKEARREVLEDLMDVDNAVLVLKEIEKGTIKTKEITTTIPSPFSFNLVMQGYVDLLRIEEKTEFLKRMHQLVLAKIGQKGGLERSKELSPESLYRGLWKKSEEERQKNRDERKENLAAMTWNLKHVPGFAKMEIVKLIEGDKNIREDVVQSIHKYEEQIKKSWPKELSEFVLEAVKEC